MVATDGGLYPRGEITQGRRGQALKKLQADGRGSPSKGKTEDAQEKWRSNSHRKERRGCPSQGNRSRGLKVPYIKVHETRVYSAGQELGGEKRLRGWGQTGRPWRLGPKEGSFPSAPGPALVQWRSPRVLPYLGLWSPTVPGSFHSPQQTCSSHQILESDQITPLHKVTRSGPEEVTRSL